MGPADEDDAEFVFGIDAADVVVIAAADAVDDAVDDAFDVAAADAAAAVTSELRAGTDESCSLVAGRTAALELLSNPKKMLEARFSGEIRWSTSAHTHLGL